MRRTALKLFTIMWLLGMYIMLLTTFLVAYQSPQKAVRVAINQYNEAQMEFFMLTGALLVAFAGTAYLISDIRRDYFERQRRYLDGVYEKEI